MNLLRSILSLLALAASVATVRADANITVLATAGTAPAGPAAAPVAAPFTREQFIAALTRDLAAHFNLEGELQLDLVRAWSAPARAATTWEVSVLEYPSAPSSSMLVRVRVSADGKPVASSVDAGVILRASLWRDVWAARQPITAGSAFDPSVLEPRRVDLFRDRDALPAAAGDRTFIFARAVSAGRMLTWRDIARRPLVKKGDVVEVSATSGLLLVTMKALAMENGAQGDTVTVRNPESQKNFAAIVVDENRVQVRF
ncbi:MAG: flagellar basal body P-ring formation chaperone FlgA [Verrucomicrobia bacterium]|nr:flagellar basal body P-ring formation chaperone FlgA [Verrucomicrobiota bacterium]